MNYGSWAVVGLTFGWIIRRRLHGWWSKYNFVLSSAMDSSVGIAGVIIFLTVFFTGASKNFNWWGTEVYKVFWTDHRFVNQANLYQNTCDWKGCAHLDIPESGKFTQ
jgi:hypothetical protein